MTRYIYTCIGKNVHSFYPGLEIGLSIPTLPAWLEVYQTKVPVGVQVDITDVDESGTFEYEFDAFTLVVVVSAECTTAHSTCCTGNNYFNIAWTNRFGGRQNYIFDGIYDLEGRFEGGEQQFEKEYILKTSDVGNVYDGVIATARDIPVEHVQIIWSLKYSVQAWLWNFDTERFDIPIILDRESIRKRRSKDRFFNVSIRFRYAERIRIQTQ